MDDSEIALNDAFDEGFFQGIEQLRERIFKDLDIHAESIGPMQVIHIKNLVDISYIKEKR